jgi:RNA recognition motif-containing protein
LSGSDDSDHSESEDINAPDKTAEKWAPSQLFVSGLPYETTEDQLKQFFGEIAKDITSIKLPKY